jgi:ubiquinone/menaquinone biosynthesis C-methylase UbiE
MPDVWAAVTDLDAATQARLADVLETRGADPQQRELRRAFLVDIDIPADALVLEVGCGTGVLTRALAQLPAVASVIGVDVAPSLLERARQLASDLPAIESREGDARSLPFEDEAFDVVVFDSTLSHVPGPERALAEAFRVLRPGGILAAFDGDYATTTVALGDHDPLQACVDAMVANNVQDRWLMRRLPELVRRAGFDAASFRSHGYLETSGGEYMLTIVDRGIDVLRALGQLDGDGAAALRDEGRRRVATGAFFGHIAYVSVVARRPG